MSDTITVQEAAKVFKALSDPNRLAIVLSLLDGEKGQSEWVGILPFTQPVIAHHLSILCESGVIISRRDGKNVYYRINSDADGKLADAAQLLQSFLSANSAPAQKPEPIKSVRRAPKKAAPAPAEEETTPAAAEPAPEPEKPRRREVFDFFD